MFGGNTYLPVAVSFDWDPAADDYLPVWRAPFACTVRGAYVTVANDVSGSTANYFDLALYNGGTAGTATNIIAGTIGGTAGWTGLLPVAFTVGTGDLTAGQLVTVHYNETGTGTFAAMTVFSSGISMYALGLLFQLVLGWSFTASVFTSTTSRSATSKPG